MVRGWFKVRLHMGGLMEIDGVNSVTDAVSIITQGFSKGCASTADH